jgi:hypothetical protein
MIDTSVRSPISPILSTTPGDAEVRRVSAKRLLMLSLLACAVAATFGAKPLAAWVDASLVSGTFVQGAVDEWSDVMRRVGVTRPYDMLRNTIRDAEAARFPGRD